uniref:Uncharacterized protein n=1 Tax=viral metagenome TaxID=1070528 RepID=A0A6C0KLM6_9ZZZZ
MKHISLFSDTSDYLPILNGVLLTDLLVIAFLLSGAIGSSVLRAWYRQYSLGAVIADVLIIVIGIILARFLYPIFFKEYSLVRFLFLVVVIQVIHDLLFYGLAVSIPRGSSRIMDVFKDYGKEVGFQAILSDSAMMVSSVLLATLLKQQTMNANILVLIASVYLVPYMIYSV